MLQKIWSVLFLVCFFNAASAQETAWNEERLNTAASAKYMQPEEREMIYEINRLRSNPSRYAKLFVAIRLANAVKVLQEEGRGDSSYSLTFTYLENDKTTVDTNWHFSFEEDVNALQTLYDTLMRLKPLSILQPDEGIYKACIQHVKDQAPTGQMNHRGADGSWPWDRIKKYSPAMVFGNENLAYNGDAPPRIIVLQLLDDSGIPGYGHRYNLLEEEWTHTACFKVRKLTPNANWWIQEFGRKK